MANHIGDSETSSTASTSPPVEGIDRRSFLMRHAVIGAAAVMTGTAWTPEARAQQAAKEAAASEARRRRFRPTSMWSRRPRAR